MKVEDIEIHAGEIARRYNVIGPVSATVGAATAFSKTPTIEDAGFKLREVALRAGANAVINVQYERGITALSWKALTAKGTAVVAETDEISCPFCAETIRRDAVVCRYCGRDLPATPQAAWYPDPIGHHQMRYWDGREWSAHVSNDGDMSVDPIPTA